ncbi:MAG: endonuclease/exonuclease/phosphatase family protein, partial [Bacteroidota bacterium]
MSIISNLRSALPSTRPIIRAGQAAGNTASKVVAPFGIVRNPLAPPPVPKDTLRIMSYNACLGGKDYPNLKRNIQKSGADVVGLQEITRENAEKLAKELGMHLAYYDRPDVAGKAILSRYPIQSGKHVEYSVSLGDRLGAFFNQVKDGQGSIG